MQDISTKELAEVEKEIQELQMQIGKYESFQTEAELEEEYKRIDAVLTRSKQAYVKKLKELRAASRELEEECNRLMRIYGKILPEDEYELSMILAEQVSIYNVLNSIHSRQQEELTALREKVMQKK